MKTVIYYFTGTGNSLRAARMIASKLGEARLISMRSDPTTVPATDTDCIGFLCPSYEWDVPQTVVTFVEKLKVNPKAYFFQVVTYVAVHGRAFETIDKLLRKKGTHLHYGKALRCVASQCTAYEPFPPAKIMVPRADRQALKIGAEIAQRKIRKYPHMSPVSRKLYPKLMQPFINVETEYDKGFYTSDKCVGCEVCRKVCPCDNITFTDHKPTWNHACLGCNACVVYCPTKAIQFKTPEAYEQLNNVITKKLGLPESRTRYHNPHVTAADLMKNSSVVVRKTKDK